MEDQTVAPLAGMLVDGAEFVLGLACIALAAGLLRLVRRPASQPHAIALRSAMIVLGLLGLLHLLIPASALLGPIGVGVVRLVTLAVTAAALAATWVVWRRTAAPRVEDGPAAPSDATRSDATRSDATLRLQDADTLNRELSARIDRLGTLAGGAAHDFNNLLTVIAGHTDMLRTILDAGTDAPARHSLTAIEGAARRAEALARQMLAYSGRGHYVLAATALNDCIRRVDPVTRGGDGVEVVLDLADDLPIIDAAPLQLQQLIEELLRNALEATSEADLGVGEVHVRSLVETLDDDDLARSACPHELDAGEFVVLEIRDTGQGMDPEVTARAFEPYFSSRAAGRGLGLAAVHGIARGHGAALLVDSTPGAGTSVRVVFPQSDSTHDVFRARRGGSDVRRVLILDDEPALLELAAVYCERLGMEPITTDDPDEAVAILLTEGARIQAVILDYLMPLRTGDEVLREIRQFSAVDVYLTSGFSRSEFHDEELHAELAGFISKPFRVEDFEAAFDRRAQPR
ncbi:MAG TPA: ATP-binding protein [Pseudomonadales bacterium]|nr:ATP-binding protein [Pseudomonadales bacterium]